MLNRFRYRCGFPTRNLANHFDPRRRSKFTVVCKRGGLALRPLLQRGLEGNVEALRQLDQASVQ
jgi:hypothetical protein